MSKKYSYVNRILCWLTGFLIIFGSMNLIIFTSPMVRAEGGSPEIHLNELGFSTEFTNTPSTTLYCPRFEQSSDWETQITLNNPSENGANIYINYFTSAGSPIDQITEFIEPDDWIEFIPTDHDINQESGSIVISTDVPINGNVIYYSNYCAAAEPLQYSESSMLYCPGFYQTTEWATWLCVNNVGINSDDVTITYYDEYGTEIDSADDTLSPNEIRFFQPSDDDIETSFGSVVIDSDSESLVGYVLKINTDQTIAYSYTLSSVLANDHCTVFVTGEDNTDEVILFNPESSLKYLDITFYDEVGNQIDSITDHELDGYCTYKILVNDYDDGNSFGSVIIESDGNGIVGCFGHIGENYGLANSIDMTSEETSYCSFESFAEDIPFPTIFITNPTDNPEDIEYTMYYKYEDNSIGSRAGGLLLLDLYSSDIFPDVNFFNWYPGRGVCGNPSSGGDLPDWWYTPDYDNDGLPDVIENKLFPPTSPPSDIDNDGKPDGKKDPDTDGDGLPDGWEYYRLGGKDPIIDDGTTNDYYGPDGDPDADGLDNIDEYNEGTLPMDSDTDGDGLSDGVEVYTYGTDPLNSDSDDDKLTDYEEVETYYTDPLDSDSDDDDMPDGWEVYYGLDPNYSFDADSDPDDDWLNNIDEYYAHTSPNDPDCDGDGRPDGPEVHTNLDPLSNDIKWVVMVYGAADCSLQTEICYDIFNEMEAVGCTDKITTIAQVDRKSIGQGVLAFKNPRRLLIVNNDEYIMENLVESSTGDPDTLFDFIDWGLDNFPADKYALIVSGHGWGFRGCLPDSKDGLYSGQTPDDYDDYLTLDEFDDCCFGNFDLVGFDVCKMGSVEVLSELYYENVEIVVASEWLEQGDGWPYDDILGWLNDNPSCTAKQFGTQIVEEYHNEWPNDILCAIDLNNYPNLEDYCKKLTKELKEAMEDDDPELKNHYKNTTFPSAVENADFTGDNLGDLYYFADWLSNSNNVYVFNSNDTYAINIRNYASRVKRYLYDGISSEKCVYHLKKGSQYSGSKGINVYLPYHADDIVDWLNTKSDYINLTFSKKTNWDDMLEIKVEYV